MVGMRLAWDILRIDEDQAQENGRATHHDLAY